MLNDFPDFPHKFAFGTTSLTPTHSNYQFSSEGGKHHDRPSTAWMRWQNAMAGLIGS
ncbi:hypothetical protein [Alteromonas stellipolaris]|uniref:hypothetical protein n=1 Tax=Alteromonas stellipolaris TaxID=233316 RepID=UPI0035660EAC